MFPASANDFEKEADQLFERRFSNGTINGTGHIFSIVVSCDKKRLGVASETLQKGQTQTVEYDFVLEVNTQQKSKSKIVGGGLDRTVETCILSQYNKELFFAPGAPQIMANRVRFPAILAKGRKPLFPETPIGFISQER